MRSLAVTGLSVLTAAAMTALPGLASSASADILLSESFTGPTSSLPFRVGGSFVPCLTASTNTGQDDVPGCAAGQPSIPVGGDPSGLGALRLTDNAHDRSGFAIYRSALPFTHGLRFTFTTFAYHGTRVPGYGAADGISVFLADGSVGAQRPGAFGGSLGYAQKSLDFNATVPDIAGVPGGYLGVGIDEFGNFANDREARGYGCANRVDQNLHPNYISLRGAGIPGSDWMRGYCLLDRTAAPGVLDQPDALVRTAPGVAHTFRIDIDPLGNPDGTENGDARVRVWADMANSGSFAPVLDAPLPPDPPRTFEFGLAASTGQGTNIHEVRAVNLQTVTSLPQYTLTKTHVDPIVAGTVGSFTLQVALAAAGGAAYAPIELEDRLPNGLTIAATPHGTGWNCEQTLVGASTARCTHEASLTDPIAPGTVLSPVTVPARVAPDADGHLVNVARLSGPEILDPIEADDPFDLHRSADVSLTKRADPTRIPVGGRTTYTLVVTNHGPSDATAVRVEDVPSTGLAFGDVTPSQGRCTRTEQSLHCELGTLAAGASAQIVTDATATAEAAGRSLPNTATVSADDDEDPSNNTARASVVVPGPPSANPPTSSTGPSQSSDPGAALRIVKRASRGQVRVGEPVDYELAITNAGRATAHDVLLTDTTTLPGTIRTASGVTGCTRGEGLVQCRLGDVEPGQTITIRARVTYDRAGQATNTATLAPADGSLADRTDTARVRILGGAALRIRKTADRSTVRVGRRVRYRITVRSLGPQPARAVRVCDRLPAALELLSAPGGHGRRTVCWRLPALAAGASRSFTVLTRAIRSTPRARNRAIADARNTRPVSATEVVAVTARPRPPCAAGERRRVDRLQATIAC